ncbi:hypothetical protein PTTG_09095 [Puccinia triticina 1-1 BBBD Race 1]|uniref:Uncharacterized protein n=1 Tax=Puccinia triticina (isolate 1-1 / race 1 (BBBD)) TaxID=630390 RepID=A0A0C4F7G2_PUCT1|nr:hypothetical protein PTTG_09095 [Puccinia triticina 1-1 BBBD Race 1]
MFKSLMSARPPLQATLNPVPASAEDLSSKTRPKKPVNPDPYAKYALIPKYHEDEENHSDGESVVGDIQFNTEAVPRHDKMGFTPYFNKNIRELKGPIPLTIFNKAWKNCAILYYAEKRSKFEDSSSDRNHYTGYPYPSEWTQSFSDWTSNHQNFYSTLKVKYNFKRMANWLLAHKANADAILAKDGFMVALHYNIQVQTKAFAHCVALADGSQLVANISVFRSKIAHSCYATARKFDELDFTDNPYAENGT